MSQQTHTVLFMCPHGAAKSVMAKTYFQKRAKEQGLAIDADAAGPFPDAAVYPAVVELLAAEGCQLDHPEPRKVTAHDIAQAQQLVSIGCNINDLPSTDKAIDSWDDVPMVSKDIHAAWQGVKGHVEEMVGRLER